MSTPKHLLHSLLFLIILACTARAEEKLSISEIVAANGGGLTDQDGDSSDWIEIFNDGTNSVNLAGWHLTDNSGNLAEWTFPATTINAGGFVIVFASGKDRAVAGAELHTNFKLAKEGDYLAFVKPDGVTVVQDFNPAYPQQLDDYSYGLGMTNVITSGTPSMTDPATLGPYVYLRADAGVGTNASGNVTNWTDQSANGFVFQANQPHASANDPVVVVGPMAGTRAINFDGTDIMDSDANLQLFTTASSGLTVFVVLKPAIVNGSQHFVVNHAPGVGGDSFELGPDAGQVQPSGAWGIHRGDGHATSTGPNVMVQGQYRLTTSEILTTGSSGANTHFYTNGVLIANAAGGWLSAGSYNTGSDPLAIGARVDNKGNGFNNLTPDGYFNGDIAEIIIIRRVLTTGERTGVDNYLLNKYGLPLPNTVVSTHIAPGQIGYFPSPTPGSANGTPLDGFVAAPTFSLDRGVYDSNLSLTISCATPGAVIRYTTNSTLPSPTSDIYSGPLNISHTLVLRTTAYKSNYIASAVDTHSYIILNDVLQQPSQPAGFPTSWTYASANYEMDPEVVTNPVYNPVLKPCLVELPTLSLVTDKSNLWDSVNGIYSHPQSSGDAWERPVSFEYINPNTGVTFQYDAGLRIHGGVSRQGVKQSFNLKFSSDYGISELDYPLLPDSAVATFDSFVLRSQWNDGWNHTYDDNNTATYVRDEWSRRVFSEMGHLSTVGDYMHLYVDGLYWGLYNPVEHINAAFVSIHQGGSKTNYDVLKFNSGIEVEDGSTADWNTLIILAEAGLASNAAYTNIQRYVDVDDLIDFMILYIYIGNEDGPDKNYYAWHQHAPYGRFGFIPWDNEWCLDHSFSGHDLTNVNVVNVDAANTPMRLYQRLRDNPEFRVRFGDHIQKHFFNGGVLNVATNQLRYAQLISFITNAIVGESARWGDTFNATNSGHPYTRNVEWARENGFLLNTFFPLRHDIVINQFRGASLFPTVGAPAFNQFGGAVTAGFGLTMSQTNASGTIYYTIDGSDPRVPITGAVAASAQAYSTAITINTTAFIRARVLSGGQWSALVETTFYPPQNLDKLALTEIMYHAPNVGATNGDEFDFIELKNVGTNALNLSGLTFTAGVTFTFTNGTTLGTNQFFLLARNPAAMAAKYPGVTVNGIFTGKLDNGGEGITLSHPLGATVFSVTYDDEVPWPLAADGLGYSLVPIHPGLTQAPDDGAKWRASALIGGSPGADDPAPGVAPIVINEVLSHTDLPQVDAIELFNPTTTNVDISGWYLTDDEGTPAKYRIPNGTTIAAGGYVTFDESQFNATPGIGTSFALSSAGESVYLFSATNGVFTGYSHGLVFGAEYTGVSFGRYVNSVGEEQFPAQTALTLGGTNAGPRIGPIVFNEINYHPDVNGDEFIELLNLTTNAVPLYDTGHPTNTWKVDGIGYTFPTNITVPPHGLILVVVTNPATFRSKYGVPAGVQIFGPYSGTLQDSGEKIGITAPDLPDPTGAVSYVTREEVRYDNKAPWPPAAAGSGLSLQRLQAPAYGNDPTNWIADSPTPGQLNPTADADSDGLPDAWELSHGTDWLTPDAGQDPDHDGLSNLQEYLSGTDPLDPASCLMLSVLSVNGSGVTLQFPAVSNRTYSVLYKSTLDQTWSRVADVASQSTNRLETVTHTPTTDAARFYRVVTPTAP